MADRIRVLIVDDIPETRDHLAKLLGFEADIEVAGTASSGAEAIAQATKLLPDVILMDINMPDMDGIAATERLSAAGAYGGRRDDVGPGRGGLPAPIDARGRPRVPRQAVQQRRADGVDPAGLLARTREGRPSRGPGAVAPRVESPEAMGTVVAVFSPKGGVGRTTIAVNLAVAAATEFEQEGHPRGRLVPVRRRGRPAQPQPQRQVDVRARSRPGGRRRRRRGRHVHDEPLLRHSRHPGPALARDGGRDHARPASSVSSRSCGSATSWWSSTARRGSTT